jgi:hypothetical protein
MLPTVTTIGYLHNPTVGVAEARIKAVEAAARAHNVQLVIENAGNPYEIEPAFKRLVAQNMGALVFGTSPLFIARTGQLVELAARYAPASGSECALIADGKQSSTGLRQLAAIGCPIVWDVAVIAVGVEIDSTGDAVAHGIAVAIFAVIPVIPEMPPGKRRGGDREHRDGRGGEEQCSHHAILLLSYRVIARFLRHVTTIFNHLRELSGGGVERGAPLGHSVDHIS